MAACKLLCLVIFFAFVTQGYGYNHLDYLKLTQSKTGKMVQNKPEWEVKVTDTNSCEFMNIKLSCTGFKSVTTIESSVLSKTDNGCLLNNGHGLFYQGSFAFKYVWDTRYDFKIIDATIACS